MTNQVDLLVGNMLAILIYGDMTYLTNDAINLTKSTYEMTTKNNSAAKEHFGLEAGTYTNVSIYETPYLKI